MQDFAATAGMHHCMITNIYIIGTAAGPPAFFECKELFPDLNISHTPPLSARCSMLTKWQIAFSSNYITGAQDRPLIQNRIKGPMQLSCLMHHYDANLCQSSPCGLSH